MDDLMKQEEQALPKNKVKLPGKKHRWPKVLLALILGLGAYSCTLSGAGAGMARCRLTGCAQQSAQHAPGSFL